MSNKQKVIAIFAALFPVAAFADISGTLTVNANTQVNMDTATTVTSGADFQWNGTTLTPQGSAKAFASPALTGMSTYNLLTGSLIASEASLGSSSPITGLAVNSIVGYVTNGGNFGKLIVTSLAGGTLVFQYTTYINITPTITAVQNNYSLLVPGLPNFGIAPGSLFIIKGSNLASIPTSSVTLQSSAGSGIPKTLNGASISVTVNGTTVQPGIYYAGSTQIAAVLPSNTPIGTGTVTVTYSGAASNAFSFQVVATALGLDTYYGSGTGLGVATNPTTGALYNYANSIAPGSTIVLWGSGAGSTGDSDTVFTTTPHAASTVPTIYIGGVQATVLYAGSAGYPGVDQINVTVPASVPTGCGVSLVAVSGNIASNSISLPIGTGVCSDPLLGINGTQLNNQTGSTNAFSSGTLELLQITTTGPQGQVQTDASANFFSYSSGTTALSALSSLNSLGSCSVSTSAVNSNVTGITLPTGLDAGTITITGSAGTQTLSNQPNTLGTGPSGMYVDLLANSFFGSGGTFTFTGTGGANVGAFTASVAYTNPLSWTNSSSITTVTRGSGQNVTWTGGAPNSYVYINGGSSSSTASATFTCYAPASAGQFTIPPYVLLALPAASGHMGITNLTTPVPFSASGLNQGGALVGVSFSIGVTYN